ncbi:PP2C family protein-serine/threonine phosphatase [[Mycoplasma] anseris]|uniref:Serine/threonine-protein phosphatase n=1 Tax=[Mycoplasma] anseris TaxID=92400 RepID=A0A2Z4ND87_9BACT|nr:protein phosphatase 2C domain-containing protein [[Mycoplasma] anseris]AWX69519.1 serine/threonine-protein phosphatase [[Mycoplasma] anseris]
MDFFLKTDKGLIRPHNEDRVKICLGRETVLAILCDGMGGHYGGAKCASLVTDLFETYFKTNFPHDVQYDNKIAINHWFIDALEFIKENLENFAILNPEYSDMGSTLTAALIFPNQKYLYIFNVGDSRTYIYNGLLYQVTEDQNIKNAWVKEGKIKKENADNLKYGNRLTSCIGPKKQMNPDGVIYGKDSNPKYIILTSDGLHDFVEKPFMELVMQQNISLKEKAEKLIDCAKKNHSNDNMSIIIVEV